MMNICFLAADSVHSWRWIKYFADRGHGVTWISFTPTELEEIPGVDYRVVRGGVLSARREIGRILAATAPDVVHAHYAGRYGLLGALSGYQPYVLTAWGSDVLFAGQSWVKGPFVKYALRKAQVVTCDAEHMRTAMVGLGVEDQKIHRINFGIDTTDYIPAAPDDPRSQYATTDGPMIVSLRNFEPVYDVATLIRAIPVVLDRCANARFVIGGSGSEEGMLKGLVEALGLNRFVTFTGRLDRDEIKRLFQAAAVYVSTAKSDAGIAASTAEAMACGVPAVVTDSGENRDWVRDGQEGFLVPVGDSKSLAECILRLLDDDELHSECGRGARRIVCENNDYTAEMTKMESLYSSLQQTAGGKR
jgi:L-malate glycosyltransferase